MFTVEETVLISAFDHSSRAAVIMNMLAEAKEVDNPELKEQILHTAEKLKKAKDEDFKYLAVKGPDQKRYVSLPEALFGKGEFYLLRAAGDSMEDKDICDGDLVLIRKQPDCEIGDIVVALDDNNENTLKVYGGIDKRTKKVILKYANEAVYPGKRILVNELTVQGVAKHVIKAL